MGRAEQLDQRTVMMFVSSEQFMLQARQAERLTVQQEKELFAQMQAGDDQAAQRLAQSYLPTVAATAQRVSPGGKPSLELICRFVAVLEQEVKTFDFSQDREHFSHRLRLALKKAITAYIADQP